MTPGHPQVNNLILAILFLFLTDDLSHIENKLRKCQDAVQLVYKMEKKLCNDNTVSIGHPQTLNQCANMDTFSNNSLIQLESILLTTASIPSLSQGVLYMFPVILTDTIIVRYAFYIFYSLSQSCTISIIFTILFNN